MPGGVLVASTSIGDVNRTVGRLRLILIIGSVGAGLLVAFGVVLVLRRGLRPIEAMATEADRITAGDLADRVSRHDPRTEVGRLGTALNGMLARIETSVGEQAASQELTRQFFADASHELRTPLASLRANAELYQQGALTTRPQVDEAMRRITLEAQRMGKLVDDMLRLARLDQHSDPDHDLVDLSALVTDSAEAGQADWRAADLADGHRSRAGHDRRPRIAAPRGRQPAGERPHPHPGRHRRDDQRRAQQRLSRDRRLRRRARGVRRPAAAAVRPLLPAAGLEPAGQAECPGSGLGLAIVTAVAATHHGTAQASLNEPHGLRVTLTLPATDAPG